MVATLLAAAIAAGCAGKPATSPTVTLRVLNWAPELELQIEQQIASRFEAAHPGVRIVVESVVENYGEKLITSIASGAPPDVFLLDAPDTPAFVERGLVLDLAPYAARAGFEPAAVFPQAAEAFARGERLYAFPKDFTPMVLYTNALAFKRRGVALPAGDWTFEEFLQKARALSGDLDGDGRNDVYALNFPRQLYEWNPFVWSAGADFMSPDGRSVTGYLDAPATVAAFEFLTTLASLQVTPPVQFLRQGDPSRYSRFYGGQQAMLLSGHWSLPTLVKYAARGRLELGIAPIPHRAGAPPQTVLFMSGWAVPASVRHKRLAIEVASFLAGAAAQRVRCEARLAIPALRGVAQDLAARDRSGLERAFLAQVPRGRVTWGARVMDFHEIEEMSLDIMDRHMLRGEPLAQAAHEVAREIDGARSATAR